MLTSNLQIQVGTLCVLATNNTNYIGYDGLCVQKSTTFRSIVVERLKWSDMGRPCAKFAQLVIFLDVDGQIDPFLLLSLLAFDVCCVGNF